MKMITTKKRKKEVTENIQMMGRAPITKRKKMYLLV
jgi:hypothetical protein